MERKMQISRPIIKTILETLNEKKAQNIKVFDVKHLTSLCEYIIISSTTNSTHVRSLADDVAKTLKNNGIEYFNIERDIGYTWVVLDCDYFVVNIFHNKAREFYNLEGIWADANEL